VDEQQLTLNAKLRGHYQYYGRRTNFASLRRFYREVCGIWRKWLNRRTRGSPLTWEKFYNVLRQNPLLTPEIRHT
jgi:RNA-directed DNA polymerase